MEILERFLNYVKIDSQSQEDSKSCPSTKKQFDMANLLVKELKELGVKDVTLSDNCYVYAKIKGNMLDSKTLGLIAHMDTAPSASGTNVKPILHKDYDGENIVYPNGAVLDTIVCPELKNYIGQTIITSSGDTLLGCDDKGGVAIIMSVVEKIMKNKDIPHPNLAIAFTPDEEIGRGPAKFDVEKFGADFGYTVDGGAIGELEYENFNGAACKITVNGKSFHTGEAKHKLVNAITIMSEIMNMFPTNQTPETTEGYEGFYHLDKIEGRVEQVKGDMIIRDHDMAKFEEKKNFVKEIEKFINAKYGEGTAVFEVSDTYFNMIEKIKPHMHLIDNAKKAFEANQVEPIIQPIRGATDGATLSFKGLPCPNISTGGHNFHGNFEYVPLESLEKMVDVVLELVKLYS